jgi:signal transduction histidine kinase
MVTPGSTSRSDHDPVSATKASDVGDLFGQPSGADGTRARWEFLARASRHLADSLDYETTLETVAGLSLPQLGSWSIVDLTQPDGSVQRLAVVHPDPEKQRIARQLKKGWPPQRDDPAGISVVALTGQSQLVATIDDDLLAKLAGGTRTLRHLRLLGIASMMTVPMRARGRVLGAITFISASTERPFDDDDLSLAEDLADRCALAIDNARLHRDAQALAGAHAAALRAEAADRLKTELMTTVSHELRTPLNVMAGYLELLAMELAGPLTSLQRRYLERVKGSEEQLLRIVEDLLNFARLHEGAIRYQPVDLAVQRVVEEVAEAYRAALEGKGLEFEVRCGPEVRAYTDPAKVWQILANLLSNARKFTDPGGKVTAQCERVDDRVLIRVHDTGNGIPPEKLEAIFEPFVHANSSLARSTEGMGLGLAISRHLARDMGGDLQVESVPGEGSTFSLILPPAQG